MNIGSTRARPRLALVGDFDHTVLSRLKQLFPTTWEATDFSHLSGQVDFREIDLAVIGINYGMNVDNDGYWRFINANSAHIICFADRYLQLPGPFQKTFIANNSTTTTEEYLLPPISLNFHQRREQDLASVQNVRGWMHYYLSQPKEMSSEDFIELKNQYLTYAIILDKPDKKPLAVMYYREVEQSRLGVACLPSLFSQYEWIELISMEWATNDKDRFPDFGDWTKTPDWMVPEEEELTNRIYELNEQKRRTLEQIDQDIAILSQQLRDLTLTTNKGQRRLLTAQGNELVAEVEEILDRIGFEVDNVDDNLPEGSAKREDLRIRLPQVEDRNWEAIIEVRGYSRSAGRLDDLYRLGTRFTSLYQQEKGRLPDKKIYVVNGMIDIANPSQRQAPFASAPGDIQAFSEDNGLVISTIDLFKLTKLLDQYPLAEIRRSIKEAVGRWTVELLVSNLTDV